MSTEETLSGGENIEGRDLTTDVTAAHVATCARARDWPVLAAQPARLPLQRHLQDKPL